MIPSNCWDRAIPSNTGPRAHARDPLKLIGSRESRTLPGFQPKELLSPVTPAPPRALRARPPTQGAMGAAAPLLGRSEGADSHRPIRGLEAAARPTSPSLCSRLAGSIDPLFPGKLKRLFRARGLSRGSQASAWRPCSRTKNS